MRTFSVLLLEDNETMMRLIDNTPLMDLAIALKFTEPDLQEFFFSNMPLHKKQTIMDLMNELEQISQEEALQIQHKIIDEAKKFFIKS